MADNKYYEFSEMEKLVLDKLRFGYSNSEIAEKLNFSSYTIKYHIAKIIRKTNAVNRINAVYILAKNGYFKDCEPELQQY